VEVVVGERGVRKVGGVVGCGFYGLEGGGGEGG
jgi:hypothetical protein